MKTYPSDGTQTAKNRKPTDYTLWHRPARGTPFLLDWGTKDAMETKLQEISVEPPQNTELTKTAEQLAHRMTL